MKKEMSIENKKENIYFLLFFFLLIISTRNARVHVHVATA